LKGEDLPPQEIKFAEEPESDTERGVPGLLPKLEETLGAVYK
jgi:hypothetical protein